MMQSDSLQTPKSGSSRFSKALPTPPAFNTRPPSKQLPSIPLNLTPKVAAMSDKPLPLPLPRTSSLPPAPPAKNPDPSVISIPRRPVAPAKDLPPVQEQPKMQTGHSPAGSISSLLSAYSRSSGESLVRSSNGSGTASQRDSEPTLSPGHDGIMGGKKELLTPLSTFYNDDEPVQQAQGGPPNFTAEKGLPRPPVFEYEREQRPAPPSKTEPAPAPAPVAAPADIAAASPTRPQIWRRRSVKSEKSVDVFDLKLTVSHGSTAASQPPASKATYSPFPSTTRTSPSQQLPPLQPPQSLGGLPGRNIRPVASREVLPAPETMGQKATKLKEKIRNLRSEEELPNLTSHSDSALPQTQKRLPTPDYERQDVHTPLVDTIVSPVSPASSPEPPVEVRSSEVKPVIQRRAVGNSRDLHAARSLPDIKAQSPPPMTSSEAPPTIIRDFGARPGDKLVDAAATQDLQTKFPPRSSSTKPRTPWQPAERERAPAPAPAPAPSHFQEMRPPSRQNKPEAAVEYREQRMEDLPPADPRASYFPMAGEELLPFGTVVNALPLKPTMYACYTRHQKMDRSRNKNHPLTCQTCHRADAEDRFKCSWCYVRICEPCLQTFNACGRDLAKLVEHLESGDHDAVTSRPVSAGLETVAE